jgi:hypothetical protein
VLFVVLFLPTRHGDATANAASRTFRSSLITARSVSVSGC